MLESLKEHFNAVAVALEDGELIPILGAGINLCGRPADVSWRPGQFNYLPSGTELAKYLADKIGYLAGDRRVSNLARVAQYAAVMSGTRPLYRKLHSIFDGDYPVGPVHCFLASLPRQLSDAGLPAHHLILTTNYDDVLERAFEDAGESFDVVSYIAEGEQQRGKFMHLKPGGEVQIIDTPNEYRGLSLAERSVILKIHGAVSRERRDIEEDNYVITEDHYVDYLTRTDIAALVPATLVARLKNSSLLFLGYSLRDWNLRVILHRIWREQKLGTSNWAVLLDPDKLDQKSWTKHGVEIIEARLEDYITALSDYLRARFEGGEDK